MTDKKEYLVELYQSLNNWLAEVTEIQKPKVTELLKQAKLYGKALESLSEEKLAQFIDNLGYDLHEFYQQNQAQVKHSIYLGLLQESLWENLAQLTDKSQVEWAELVDDFKHKGIYHRGDIIGFGELECQQCQATHTVMHATELGECAHCGGQVFTRLPLNP